jgi:nicotinate-nucleotide pyrophosphorylase (carboxylating)
MQDLRNEIFRNLNGKAAEAVIIADSHGIIAGTERAHQVAQKMRLTVTHIAKEGSRVNKGDIIAAVQGDVKQVITGEDRLMGCISKPSGIATAAHQFIRAAAGKPRIVSGAWKKMPAELKKMIRAAVLTGGACIRISDEPFIYLDKNYISVFGGIQETLEGVTHLRGYLKVIQLKGKYKDIAAEAGEAARLGADILFVDTGNMADIRAVVASVTETGQRRRVQIAFGGGVKLEDIEPIKGLDVDILDVGQAIIDAPLLDLKYEVNTIG